jgi:hypothetical protein
VPPAASGSTAKAKAAGSTAKAKAAGSTAKAKAAEKEEEEEAKAAAMRAAAEVAEAEWRAKQEAKLEAPSWGLGGPMASPGAQEAKPQPLPSLNLWQQLNLWQ